MCIQHTLDNNFEQGIVIGCCCKVGLTDILDMYYDVCTLRYKELSLGVVAKSFKSTEAFLCQRQISIVVASGVFLVAIRILGQRYLPHFPTKKHPVNSSDMISIQHQSMESCKVVLSRDGKIVEIQPTNRIAENQWAANPLVKELYGKKKFVPGLIERGRKMITRPNDVVILELLMSSNPQSSFALVRPVTEISI
ncbi:hypothetical protein P3S68_003012 [Capsicum galapagoense]